MGVGSQTSRLAWNSHPEVVGLRPGPEAKSLLLHIRSVSKSLMPLNQQSLHPKCLNPKRINPRNASIGVKDIADLDRLQITNSREHAGVGFCEVQTNPRTNA